MKHRIVFVFIIFIIAAGVLTAYVIPNVWFKRYLGKNYNAPEPDQTNQTERHDRLCLIFALDGVPFDVMAQLHQEGFFKGFYPPGRLVSTFPSLTRPAFSKMLIGGKPFGYERLYFDGKENRIKGKTLVKKIFSNTRQYPDYHPKLHFLGFPGYIAYVFPTQFTDTAIETFKKRILEFKGSEFITYMGISDAIGHVRGQAAQKEFLKKISRLLDETRNELGTGLDVVVFSDHGNNNTENRRVDLSAVLEQNGFQDTDALVDKTDVVLVKNGFVSMAALYCLSESKKTIAGVLSGIEGVDFCVYRSGSAIRVKGRAVEAVIRREKEHFNYSMTQGDPLHLDQIMQGLKQSGKLDANGFAHTDIWWEATKDHIYPDPLFRIWEGLHDLVQYPATILVSFEDGYAFGPAIFDQNLIQGRKGTHGALLGTHSTGFFMTDFKPVEPHNRPGVVAGLLARSALSKQQGQKLNSR